MAVGSWSATSTMADALMVLQFYHSYTQKTELYMSCSLSIIGCLHGLDPRHLHHTQIKMRLTDSRISLDEQ